MTEEAADPAAADGRSEHRRRVLKGATILVGVEVSEVKCMIRDMHEDGALLVVPSEARVPETFLLYVPVDGTAYRAEKRWRSGDRIGVRFLGKEPKPRWHYG